MATRAITFIALQCFQCSTMQVKQQKKSSNKWTCVVCNEKQSVLKVFARAHMAKDVRKFVQSFNMSRQFVDSRVPAPPRSERSILVDAEDSKVATGRKMRRMDWTEYLDVGEDDDRVEGIGIASEDDQEAKVVTELPEGLFKRPKLKDDACKSGCPKGTNLYKPQFSGRNIAKSAISLVQTSKKLQPETLSQNSRGKHYQTEIKVDVGLRDVQLTGARKESRWSSYMTQEDDNFRSGTRENTSQSNFLNETCQLDCHLLEAVPKDQVVEDDIHPDFV